MLTSHLRVPTAQQSHFSQHHSPWFKKSDPLPGFWLIEHRPKGCPTWVGLPFNFPHSPSTDSNVRKTESVTVSSHQEFLLQHACASSVTKSRFTLCNPMDYIAHQSPLSMGFPRQEYWSELPFPPPGHLPDPGIKPKSPALAGRIFTTAPPGKLSCYRSWH